jgi:hypothetical protein
VLQQSLLRKAAKRSKAEGPAFSQNLTGRGTGGNWRNLLWEERKETMTPVKARETEVQIASDVNDKDQCDVMKYEDVVTYEEPVFLKSGVDKDWQ